MKDDVEEAGFTDIYISWTKDFHGKDSCIYEVGTGTGLRRHLTDGCELRIKRTGTNLTITNTSSEPWNFLE